MRLSLHNIKYDVEGDGNEGPEVRDDQRDRYGRDHNGTLRSC